MSARTLIKGIPLTLGNTTYTMPPASLATLEDNSDKLDKVNAAFAGNSTFSLADLLFVTDFATACLRRNYPDLDRSVVSENVGLDNVVDVLQICLDTSGLLRKKLESQSESLPNGTAQEGGTLGESNGTASSPTS